MRDGVLVPVGVRLLQVTKSFPIELTGIAGARHFESRLEGAIGLACNFVGHPATLARHAGTVNAVSGLPDPRYLPL